MKSIHRIIAILLLCSVASAAEPTIKLRAYKGQADHLLNNLKVSQLHKADTVYSRLEVYLLHAGDLPGMATTAKALAEADIPFVPGFRVFENNPTADWMSPAHVAKKTAELKTVADMRSRFELRVGFDHEAYLQGAEATTATIAALGGEEKFAEVWEPFFAVIRAERIVPCMYPANPDDVFEKHCIKAAGGAGELMDEATFYYESSPRTGTPSQQLNQLVYAATRRRVFLEKYPGAKWTPAMLSEVCRDWGKRFYFPAMGERDCWVFLDVRKDETKLGTAEWLSGLSLSPLNDAEFFPFNATAGIASWSGKTAFAERWLSPIAGGGWSEVDGSHAGLKPRDPVTDGAYWPAGGRYLKAPLDFGHTSKPLTIAADVYLASPEPAAFGGVWAYRANGYQSWQVRFDGAAWVFDWSSPAHVWARAAISLPAKVGAWQRLVVTIADGQASMSVDGVAKTIPCALRDAPTIAFTLGLCGMDGYKPLFGEGLRIKNLHAWQRVVAPVGSYPFGL